MICTNCLNFCRADVEESALGSTPYIRTTLKCKAGMFQTAQYDPEIGPNVKSCTELVYPQKRVVYPKTDITTG